MANIIIGALMDGVAPKSYLMTTVTSGCVVVRNPSAASETAISLSRLSDIQIVRTSYPALLVIATGLCVIAAAAFCSKEGDGAGIPTSVMSAIFVAGFFLSRKAALKFFVDSEFTQTAFGSPRAATTLKRAVQNACAGETSLGSTPVEQPQVEVTRSLPGLLNLSAEGANS